MQTIEINNYKLNLFKTKKFKKTKISVRFLRKNKKEETLLRTLLFEMLAHSTKKYNTNRKLQIEKEDIYNLSLTVSSGSIGTNVFNSISVSFLNQNYTEKDIDTKALSLLKEIIINPNVMNDQFDKKSFDVIAEEIKTYILSIKNNPSLYAKTKAFEITDSNNPMSFSINNIEELGKITLNQLYEYYLDVIKNDQIEIFVVGDINTKLYKEYFQSNLKFENKKNDYNDYIYEYDKFENVKEVQLQEEKYKQASLVINYKIKKTTDFEKKYVSFIFNTIFGGNADSRLFKNVREKNSLAYTIRSTSHPNKGILSIYAGIDYKNFDKTKKIIENEFEKIKKNITDKEVKKAKNNYMSSLKSIYDDYNTIISYEYLRQKSVCDDILLSKENLKKVTKEDIYKYSQKIVLDTIFVLYGVE